MFVDFYVADQIAVYCAYLDMKCRLRLSQKNFIDEPSYVAVLTNLIQDKFKQENIKCRSQVLEKRHERKVGTDGMVVFQLDDKVKIGLFEAKRPRILTNSNEWDSIHKTRGVSHFSEQIEKQKIWQDQLAIWEMFFNELPPGTMNQPYDTFGSSCVWHENAHSFIHKEKLIFQSWTMDKLTELLRLSGISFYSVIFDILSCRVGKIHTIDSDGLFCTIYSQINKNLSMKIPLPTLSEDWEEEAQNFLVERRFDSYTHIEIPDNINWSWKI